MMCLMDSICIYPQPLGDLVELEPVDVAKLEHLAAARRKPREQGREAAADYSGAPLRAL
jgi:hypothetical protein